MNFPEFIDSLLLDGNMVIGPYNEVRDDELHQVARILSDFEKQYRLECPVQTPAFSTAWSCWAGLKFFRACQFALFRELDQQTMHEEFQKQGHGPDAAEAHSSPTAHYSVDLVFRFLGDLLKLTTQLAREDPLIVHLKSEAVRWPLSSVGIADLPCQTPHDVLADPCLHQMYIDRIIHTKDKRRILSKEIRDQVRISLGEDEPWSQELAQLEFEN